MEDLKEIGYEGGKTTHGDVRKAINENVAAANRNFSEVSEAATGAQEDVAELGQQLDEVSATATEAKNGVTELRRQLGEVSAVATEAQADVTELGQKLDGVSEVATEAQKGVTELGQKVEGVSAEAQEALAAANSAQHTAETAKSDAATAKSTAETASQTAETAKSTADTAKSTADTAKQTAEGAKASAEGLTGEVTELGQKVEEVSATANEAQKGVTELGQQLDEVSADATGATDGLHQFMTLGILTQAPFPRATAEASGSFAAVGGDAALKDGEIIPWTGWLTLVLCYQTTDSAAKVKLTGYAGPTLGKCELIPETAVAASEEPRVVRITGEHDYNPKRIGSPDACMAGSSYHVNVEVKSPNAGLTMLWAVVYESDEYGNPRRRGGSLRQYIETFQTKLKGIGIEHPVYNENTGFFEANGLTDLTFDDMCAINSAGIVTISSSSLYSSNKVRTNLISAPYHTISSNSQFFQTFQCYGNNSMEVFVMYGYGNSNINLNIRDYGFSGNKLRAILATIKTSGSRALTNMPKLETVYIKVDADKNFSYTDLISYDSLTYMINGSINSSAITITVSSAVYSKLSGSTVENWGSLATLASGKNITLLAKGDTGYPFLTEVLWHSYAALQKKINDATNGSTIYIHKQDKQKITSSQQDNWGTLVRLAAEKNITFAQAE